ncbi:bacterio-opsin activator domain-containing protein (plasmid) [Haladaptatus sp. SPP-AMP-3]|uniref:bacterio-opsin activator domain-containing protein n=1 Tax=Haladaptatus sp. SPP-AMP-3 TaxID=3121295 RepID=UPI003C2C6EBF
MTTAAPAPDDVIAKVVALGPPGTPVTTPEVAEGFDCTKRTIYNRLDALVEDGVLQTKKVGANSRVWWRPVSKPSENLSNGETPCREQAELQRQAELDAFRVRLTDDIRSIADPVETKETFQTDSVVELTLRSTAADSPLCRLSRATNGKLQFDGVIPQDDDSATVFFTAEDAIFEELLTASDDVLSVADLECLGDSEAGTMFKALLSGAILATHVLDRDATIRSLRFDSGTATIVADLPRSADVREFVDDLVREVPDLELLSRHIRRREPGQTLQAAVLDRLTPRQQEVLQLAYRSGYFESPRVQTGEDLAEVLDIVPSTFTRHIREAQRNVLNVVFATGEQRGVTK